jgi:hypothetical protein
MIPNSQVSRQTQLTVSGFDRWYSGAFEWGIADGGTELALWLAGHHHSLVWTMALGALIFELCSPLLLIRGWLRQYYGGVAVLFHLDSLVLLRMDFLGMALMCAAVVFDLERIPEFVARFVRAACHQLTHVIGRTAVELYGDLPGAYAHGEPACSSGHYHGVTGAIMARVGTDKVLEEADEICADPGLVATTSSASLLRCPRR